MELGFITLAFLLFGASVFLYQRDTKRTLTSQIKQLRREAMRKARDHEKRVASLESRLNDAFTVINQLKLSAPNPITTPNTPDFRKNLEDRHERELMEAKMVGRENN